MKMKISLCLLGFLTLIKISQGLSLRRSERVAENFPFFENFHQIPDQNANGNNIETWKRNYQQNLKTLPKIIEEFIIPIDNDEEPVKTFITDIPKNIILLFIQESTSNGENIWRDLKKSHVFSIRGSFQTCQNEKNAVKFPLEESMNGELSKCDCQSFLRRNIENLLDWAHQTKIAMSSVEKQGKLKRFLEKYGIFASPNFNYTIPSSLEREISILRRELFGESSHLENNWNLVDLSKRKFFPFPSLRDDDELSDFFQPFSLIRIAIFQKWLNSLYNGDVKSEHLEANLLELLKDTITKTKSLANDNKFILIAFSPGNELLSAVNFLKEKVSDKDTLLFVSGTCSEGGRGVPFFAHGPGSKYFYEANSIWDLPILVKRAATDCERLGCNIGTHNGKWDLEKKLFKRTAKNESFETTAESSTAINKITTAIENTTTKSPVKKEIDNSIAIAGNVSVTAATVTEIPVIPLKNMELKNSSFENNNSDVNNSANITNNKESMTTSSDVPNTTGKSTFENNLTDIGSTTIDSNLTSSRIISTIEDLKITTESRNLMIEHNSTDVDDKTIIDANVNASSNYLKVATNYTNGTDEDTKEIAGSSEASHFSKQISTVIISVATSFAALLLVQF